MRCWDQKASGEVNSSSAACNRDKSHETARCLCLYTSVALCRRTGEIAVAPLLKPLGGDIAIDLFSAYRLLLPQLAFIVDQEETLWRDYYSSYRVRTLLLTLILEHRLPITKAGSPPSTPSAPTMTTPRRKACVECRQQKIRCDVEQFKTPHDPCGRCKKMGLECRILPTSTRNLRQTKAEMRRELEELRWNMRSGTGLGSDPNNPASTASPNIDMQGYSPHDYGSGTYSNPSARTDGSVSPAFESRPPTRKGSENHTTLPRVIDGYFLDGAKIDECFRLFFTQYHPLFPVLDTSLSPNDYYELSPFLFWSIIVTGSRRYAEDRTVLEKTSQHIVPLAFASMARRSAQIPIIEGLLILCIWRIPTNSMYKDMAHLMCGAAVHLSTQIGLHIAGVGQDFSRTPLKKDQDQKVIRARLWLCCVIQSIRTNIADGLPPTAESLLDCDERDRDNMVPYLPADLQFLHKTYIITLRAVVALSKMNIQSIHCDVRVLRSLIGIFDQQMLSLSQSSPSEIDTLQLNCARIHILAFHFFAHPTNPGPDMESLSRFYSLCINVIHAATNLIQQSYFSFAMDRSITLAGFVLLKLVRSSLAPHLDLAAGEKAYFQAIHFLNSVSLQQGDIYVRTALIMKDLWGSNKVFMKKNGQTESLGLRLRTRLGMSVSYDMFWYWREEFGNMPNPYNGDETSATSNDPTRPTQTHMQPQPMPAMPMNSQIPMNKFDPSLVQMATDSAVMSFDTWDGSDYSVPPMMDQFPDYDWAAGFDFSNTEFPTMPTGPIGGGPMMSNNVSNVGYTFG
ncbi:hypothetical protein HBI82_086970 [Parastagonospora nodorum]|nr:hypothetical protein HBH78_117060 [Parastagonospora nodorum]KAH4705012.1 hypothetical protein HBH67_097940 [Parastagonospora nodorum]KAH4791213.1 hypothetical protein HBH62_037040 [Parastagonospora nodorum]KAH4794813.1 hypothetical protein HBH63_091090 [Parastagonospora nodorum]KAH5250779.1 hypothetical protein HBI71_158770 [Parastagonospora nodorum]